MFGVMMLFISSTSSLAIAQEYNQILKDNEMYYDDVENYEIQYKKNDKEILCDNGLYASSLENCPIKCEDTGLFIMKGMDCPEPVKPDLTIQFTELFDCVDVQPPCTPSVSLNVINSSPIPVDKEFQLNLVSSDISNIPIQTIESIAANGVISLNVELSDDGIQDGCEGCTINGFVDSTNVIMEANEENNIDSTDNIPNP